MTDEMTLEKVYAMFGDISAKELFYNWGGVNQWLFMQINSIRGEVYDSVMRIISELGDRHNFPYYLAALSGFVVLSVLVKLVRRKGGIKHYLIGWTGVLLVLCAGFAVNSAVIHVAKDYFHYPRPYIALAKDEAYASVQINLLEPSKGPEDDYRSFPSGHVAFAVLLVVALWPMLIADIQWIGILFIFAEIWSRVALGRHFPADGLGSVLIALPLTLMVRAVIYGTLRRIGLNC